MLKIIKDYQPTGASEFISVANFSIDYKYTSIEGDGKQIAVLTHSNPPVLNFHLNSKEAIAKEQLQEIFKLISVEKYFVLLGDLNINLMKQGNREEFSKLLQDHGLRLEQADVETPVLRERSTEIALNQQPSKGGEKKQEAKCFAGVLIKYTDIAQAGIPEEVEQHLLSKMDRQLIKPIGEDGLDHNLAKIEYAGVRYVAFSNIPTAKSQGKFEQINTDVAALAADQALAQQILVLLKKHGLIKLHHMTLTGVDKVFSKIAEDTVENWHGFIKDLLSGEELKLYKDKRIASSDLKCLFEKNIGDKEQFILDFFSKEFILQQYRSKRPDKVFNQSYEQLLSPQPYNGYDLKVEDIGEMERHRLNTVAEFAELENTGKVFIAANDSREKDYVHFLSFLKEEPSRIEKKRIEKIRQDGIEAGKRAALAMKPVAYDPAVSFSGPSRSINLQENCLENRYHPYINK